MHDLSPGERRASRLLAAIFLVVGLLLVANATVVHAFEVGTERYRYDAVDVRVMDGELSFAGGGRLHAPDDVRGLDCVFETDHNRLCEFEQWLLDARGTNGSVTVTTDEYNVRYPRRTPPPFAVHEGGYYFRNRTVTDPEGSPSPVRLALEPVSAGTVLDALAVPESRLDATARRAVGDGTVVTRTELDASGQIVDTGSEHVVIVGERIHGERPLVQAASFLFQFGVGTALVIRGRRGLRATRRNR